MKMRLMPYRRQHCVVQKGAGTSPLTCHPGEAQGILQRGRSSTRTAAPFFSLPLPAHPFRLGHASASLVTLVPPFGGM